MVRSLKDAAPAGVHVGFAMPNWASDAQFDFFSRHFNLLAMDNAPKPSQVFYDPRNFAIKSFAFEPDWSRADYLVREAAERGIDEFVLHTPYWPTQPIEALDIGGGGTLAEIEARAETMLQHYIEKWADNRDIVRLDLVNEVINGARAAAADNYNRGQSAALNYWTKGADKDSYWHHIIESWGDRDIAVALNDFNLEGSAGYQKVGFDKVQEIITELFESGLSIDILGFQGHLLKDPNVVYEREELALRALWLENRFGVTPAITELDHQSSNAEAQAEIHTLVSTLLEFSSMDEITGWNPVPGRIGLVDIKTLKTTPLYDAVREALEDALPVESREIPTMVPHSLRYQTPLLFERSGPAVQTTEDGLRVTAPGSKVHADWDLFGDVGETWTIEYRAE